MAKNKKYEDSHFEEYLDTQTIVNVDIEQRMKEAFIDYAMSVIVSRALPDVRDGLKPVHRRILYSMYEEHLTHDKPFFKSATTVGNVIGRYHPHSFHSFKEKKITESTVDNLSYPPIRIFIPPIVIRGQQRPHLINELFLLLHSQLNLLTALL